MSGHFHLSAMSFLIFVAQFIIASFFLRVLALWLSSSGNASTRAWGETIAVID